VREFEKILIEERRRTHVFAPRGPNSTQEPWRAFGRCDSGAIERQQTPPRGSGDQGSAMNTGANTPTRDLSEDLCDLRISTIELSERLEGLERDWLVGRLRATRGVRDIEYRGDDGRRLVVEHDAAELSRVELVDVFFRCGLPARALPPHR
jgi:hypothetical protein